MQDDGVQAAFDLIIEEIDNFSNTIKNKISNLIDSEDYDSIENLIKIAKELQKFQLKVKELKIEWITTFRGNKKNLKNKNKNFGEKKVDKKIILLSEPLRITMSYGDAFAEAEYFVKKVKVLPGSTIRKINHSSLSEPVKQMKEEAIRKKQLIELKDSGLYELKIPIEFRSLSAAAQFVAGCSVSGPREWHVRGKGENKIPLKDWLYNKKLFSGV